MKIWVSLYELNMRGKSFSFLKKREGTLLKVCFQDGLTGYADCHPWQERGDHSLQEQLNLLASQQMTPLIHSSLYWARLDAEARSRNHSLLDSMPAVANHFLVIDLASYSDEEWQSLIKMGYTHIKIKLGKKWALERDSLMHLSKTYPFKLRIDFNESLTIEECKEFLREVEPIKDKIEWIEDPFPFDPQDWNHMQEEFGIAFAADAPLLLALRSSSAQALIHKPVVYPLLPHTAHIKAITSYLDHPLGQVAAAYVAARSYPSLVHGLLSHLIYEKNSFSQWLNWQGPLFTPPPGIGLGFDELLAALRWESI